MKTLILYASKYGAAGEIARLIAQRMDDAVLHDLKQESAPDLNRFDCVIIGSSLYAGMIRKEAKTYMAQNEGALREKRLGLFLSGVGAERADGYFKANFPAGLLREAKAASFLGGIYDPAKAGALERLIMKLVAKQGGYINTIDREGIGRFAEELIA